MYLITKNVRFSNLVGVCKFPCGGLAVRNVKGLYYIGGWIIRLAYDSKYNDYRLVVESGLKRHIIIPLWAAWRAWRNTSIGLSTFERVPVPFYRFERGVSRESGEVRGMRRWSASVSAFALKECYRNIYKKMLRWRFKSLSSGATFNFGSFFLSYNEHYFAFMRVRLAEFLKHGFVKFQLVWYASFCYSCNGLAVYEVVRFILFRGQLRRLLWYRLLAQQFSVKDYFIGRDRGLKWLGRIGVYRVLFGCSGEKVKQNLFLHKLNVTLFSVVREPTIYKRLCFARVMLFFFDLYVSNFGKGVRYQQKKFVFWRSSLFSRRAGRRFFFRRCFKTLHGIFRRRARYYAGRLVCWCWFFVCRTGVIVRGFTERLFGLLRTLGFIVKTHFFTVFLWFVISCRFNELVYLFRSSFGHWVGFFDDVGFVRDEFLHRLKYFFRFEGVGLRGQSVLLPFLLDSLKVVQRRLGVDRFSAMRRDVLLMYSETTAFDKVVVSRMTQAMPFRFFCGKRKYRSRYFKFLVGFLRKTIGLHERRESIKHFVLNLLFFIIRWMFASNYFELGNAIYVHGKMRVQHVLSDSFAKLDLVVLDSMASFLALGGVGTRFLQKVIVVRLGLTKGRLYRIVVVFYIFLRLIKKLNIVLLSKLYKQMMQLGFAKVRSVLVRFIFRGSILLNDMFGLLVILFRVLYSFVWRGSVNHGLYRNFKEVLLFDFSYRVFSSYLGEAIKKFSRFCVGVLRRFTLFAVPFTVMLRPRCSNELEIGRIWTNWVAQRFIVSFTASSTPLAMVRYRIVDAYPLGTRSIFQIFAKKLFIQIVNFYSVVALGCPFVSNMRAMFRYNYLKRVDRIKKFKVIFVNGFCLRVPLEYSFFNLRFSNAFYTFEWFYMDVLMFLNKFVYVFYGMESFFWKTLSSRSFFGRLFVSLTLYLCFFFRRVVLKLLMVRFQRVVRQKRRWMDRHLRLRVNRRMRRIRWLTSVSHGFRVFKIFCLFVKLYDLILVPSIRLLRLSSFFASMLEKYKKYVFGFLVVAELGENFDCGRYLLRFSHFYLIWNFRRYVWIVQRLYRPLLNVRFCKLYVKYIVPSVPSGLALNPFSSVKPKSKRFRNAVSTFDIGEMLAVNDCVAAGVGFQRVVRGAFSFGANMPRNVLSSRRLLGHALYVDYMDYVRFKYENCKFKFLY